jgi:hypothetical protein
MHHNDDCRLVEINVKNNLFVRNMVFYMKALLKISFHCLNLLCDLYA